MMLFNNLAYTWIDGDTFLMTADGGVDNDGDTYNYAFEYHEKERKYAFERIYEHDHIDATNDFNDGQRREIKAYMRRQMYAHFPGHRKPLTGKYAKLRDDLLAAYEATAWAEETEDGGTSNFDSPVLKLPRWTEKLVEQASKEAGMGAFKWMCGKTVLGWVFSFQSTGQADRRSRRAEAMRDELAKRGYEVSMYYQMD